MRKMIIDINEMSDSREVYESRPNPFIPAFIYCLIGILVAAIIYACFGKIEIVARASGIVRPNDNVSTVASLVGGRVSDVSYLEGQIVNEGEILFTIDVSDKQILLDTVNQSMKDTAFEIEMLTKFTNGIEEEANPFQNNIMSKEYPWYIRYSNYNLSQKKTGDSLVYDADTNVANTQALRKRIEKLNLEIAGLSAYKKSVTTGQNLVSAYPEYENQYLLYETSVKALENDYHAKTDGIQNSEEENSNDYYLYYYSSLEADYENLVRSIERGESVFPQGSNTTGKLLYDDYEATLEEYKGQDFSVVTPSTYSSYSSAAAYKNKMLAQYRQALSEYQNKSKEMGYAIDSVHDTAQTDQIYLDDSYANSKNQTYLKTITQIDSSLEAAETELAASKAQLELYNLEDKLNRDSVDENGKHVAVTLAKVTQISSVLSQKELAEQKYQELSTQKRQLEDQISEGTVKAAKSGVVNVIIPLTKGDMISAGTAVATIIPSYESAYKVNLYVGNADIANIREADRIRYDIAALPARQYGVVEGNVKKIASDALVQNGQYSGYYLVEGSISGGKLTDKDGNAGTISVGMQVDAKIVTQKKTILRYFLEKINLF